MFPRTVVEMEFSEGTEPGSANEVRDVNKRCLPDALSDVEQTKENKLHDENLGSLPTNVGSNNFQNFLHFNSSVAKETEVSGSLVVKSAEGLNIDEVESCESQIISLHAVEEPSGEGHNDSEHITNDKESLSTSPVCEAENKNIPLGYAMPQYTFLSKPHLITGVWEEFKENSRECFTKGCKWSPDGTCILTNSEDNLLRIFDLPRELHCQESWFEGKTLPELKPALIIKEGGRVYDYCWYPFMSSWNPLSCCLLSTSQFSPVHLWDAYSGQLRASYRSYNQVDEIDHAFSVAFNLTGEKLYCGFKNRVSVFNTSCPGSTCENRNLKGLGRPVGIVSCICVNPANENIYAFSSYSRTIGLCSEPDGNVFCLLCNDGGGLTHMLFSPDGLRLYAGSRNNAQLYCWDMRNLGKVLFTADRTNTTNQRIYFDLTPDGQFLVSGSTNGLVHIWNMLQSPQESLDVPFLPVMNTLSAHNDCVNGISLHKQYPVMATSSGQRHPCCIECDSDDESCPVGKKRHVQREDCLKLWWVGPSTTVKED